MKKLVLRLEDSTMEKLRWIQEMRRLAGHADASIMDVVVDLIETEHERLMEGR